MIRFPRLLLLSFLVLTLSLLAFGCKGGGGATQPTATRLATETPVASATLSAATPADTPEMAEPLPFDSFHYKVDLAVTITQPGETDQSFISGSVEGDYVAPDAHSYKETYAIAGLAGTEETVIIGEDAWFREGTGAWTAMPASSQKIRDSMDLTSADPGFLSANNLADNISALNSEDETINGVETRRYHIPREAIETLKDLFGEDILGDAAGLQDFEMTVWIDKETDGLVRAELSAIADPALMDSGSTEGLTLPPGSTVAITMRIDLTQLNDDSISIEPPI